jgi:hypothetical protein
MAYAGFALPDKEMNFPRQKNIVEIAVYDAPNVKLGSRKCVKFCKSLR